MVDLPLGFRVRRIKLNDRFADFVEGVLESRFVLEVRRPRGFFRGDGSIVGVGVGGGCSSPERAGRDE